MFYSWSSLWSTIYGVSLYPSGIDRITYNPLSLSPGFTLHSASSWKPHFLLLWLEYVPNPLNFNGRTEMLGELNEIVAWAPTGHNTTLKIVHLACLFYSPITLFTSKFIFENAGFLFYLIFRTNRNYTDECARNFQIWPKTMDCKLAHLGAKVKTRILKHTQKYTNRLTATSSDSWVETEGGWVFVFGMPNTPAQSIGCACR